MLTLIIFRYLCLLVRQDFDKVGSPYWSILWIIDQKVNSLMCKLLAPVDVPPSRKVGCDCSE
jgi:hypothetical protein